MASAFSHGWHPPVNFAFVDMVRESNRIEGIERDPTEAEISEFQRFLKLDRLEVSELLHFVSVNQPGAVLRDRIGLDVRVGTHYPLKGGPHIAAMLERLLDAINAKDINAWQAHCIYEWLHPFTDGNGRSGRVIWYWSQNRSATHMLDYGFLRGFYYQTLSQGGTEEMRRCLGWEL